MKHVPRLWFALLVALLFLLRLPSAMADLTQEQVTRARGAIGLLVHANGSGTAFCVSSTGLFVTSHQVLIAADSSPLTLTFDPSNKAAKRYPVRVVRQLEQADLALLKIDLDHPVPALPLGDASALFETQPISTFGFSQAPRAKSPPAITAKVGRVTSLRKKGGVTDFVDFDVATESANLGGPVLDEQGAVVAVISEDPQGALQNFGRSIAPLIPVLKEPLIAGQAALSAAEKRYQKEVERARGATGLLLSSEGSGTAFCVAKSGVFLTNDRVLARANANTLQIVLDPAGKTEKRYPVKILQRLEEADLALLKVELDREVTPLPLGDDATLFETQQLLCFGFPSLAAGAQPYPSLSLTPSRVTSLRRKAAKLDLIQLDASLNPGHSGGPVMDEKGTVVGLVSSGVVGAGVNLAKPISLLKSLLEQPSVAVEVPIVPFAKRFAPADFVFSVNWPQPPSTEPAVLLEITHQGQARRVPATRGADGKYRASLSPLPAPPAGRPKCQVTFTFTQGQFTGTVEDFFVNVAGKPTALSDIKIIERSATAPGTFVVDDKPAGPLPEFAKISLDLGGTVMVLDGQKAAKIAITLPRADVGTIFYKVAVTIEGGKKLAASTTGIVALAGAPAPPPAALNPVAARSFQKSALREKRDFPLPSPASDVVAAGNGTTLLLHLKDAKKVAVFDVLGLKLRGYINLAEEPVLIAGGAQHIVIAYPNQNILQRYSLETLEKEKTITTPTGQITHLVMGCSSPRVALLVIKRGSYQSNYVFWDVNTMLEIPLSDASKKLSQTDGFASIRASADGRTYGISRGGSPGGFGVLCFKNNEISTFYEHTSPGRLIPNADGSLIFGTSGVFTPSYVSVLILPNNPNERVTVLPSYSPRYFFSVPFGETALKRKQNGPRNIGIYVGRSEQPLVYLPEPFAEMDPAELERVRANNPSFSLEKRYHFYPQWDLFLTVPFTNDRIVAHPIDVRQLLAEKGIDYLYVTSATPVAQAGRPLQFQLEIASKAGGVVCSLQTGPPGLTVSPAGLVQWAVPAKAVEETVIVALKDASGQEAFHTFQISATP